MFGIMALTDVCKRKQSRCLRIPLKTTEQIYLLFLTPTLLNCIVYVVNFSSDLVVAQQHFHRGNPVWGWCTIALMYNPALIYFILTISRADWWMTEDDKINKGVRVWFGLQVCQLVAFPIFALYRYAGLIVLAVDAVLLSGKERRETLNIAAAPAAIELYFFLRAWFQAAPQALLQTHLLFREYPAQRTHQSEVIQVLCIFMSVVVIAVQASSFQRFESQQISGRKLPWAMWFDKHRSQQAANCHEEIAPLKPVHAITAKQTAMSGSHEAEHTEKRREKEEEETSGVASTTRGQQQQQQQQQQQSVQKSEMVAILNRQTSTTPPLPPKNARHTPPPTPLRGITTVIPLPVPEEQAPPRPDSTANFSRNSTFNEPTEGRVTVAVVRTDFSEDDEPGNEANSFKVPRRKDSTKGLEEDDPIGVLLSFLWWYFFILARVLSIAVFYEFYPLHLGIVLGAHYILMLAYIFYNSRYRDPVTYVVNVWLGLVYILCAIEYRIKFKYADKWLLPYYTIVMLQNAAITLVWYFNADWEGFWYAYAFCAIFGSMVLSILSSTVYNVLLRPKKRRVYSSGVQ